LRAKRQRQASLPPPERGPEATRPPSH
jgi:hypothetical protein